MSTLRLDLEPNKIRKHFNVSINGKSIIRITMRILSERTWGEKYMEEEKGRCGRDVDWFPLASHQKSQLGQGLLCSSHFLSHCFQGENGFSTQPIAQSKHLKWRTICDSAPLFSSIGDIVCPLIGWALRSRMKSEIKNASRSRSEISIKNLVNSPETRICSKEEKSCKLYRNWIWAHSAMCNFWNSF